MRAERADAVRLTQSQAVNSIGYEPGGSGVLDAIVQDLDDVKGTEAFGASPVRPARRRQLPIQGCPSLKKRRLFEVYRRANRYGLPQGGDCSYRGMDIYIHFGAL